jgi:hypothetical protein
MENLNYIEIFNNITNKENKTEVRHYLIKISFIKIVEFIEYEYNSITSRFIGI